MRFLLAFLFVTPSLIGGCSGVTDSSVTVEPASAYDPDNVSRPYSGRITSDPPGVDCVLHADGTHAGVCEMTTPTSRPVVLTAVPAANSQVVGWTNVSDGSDLEGAMFAPGAALTLTMKAGTHPVWAVYFGPAR